jgi:tripartite-type tricarboxylate transporter receptor subunit TctC
MLVLMNFSILKCTEFLGSVSSFLPSQTASGLSVLLGVLLSVLYTEVMKNRIPTYPQFARRFVIIAFAFVAICAQSVGIAAEPYPSKPIRIIVTFVPGGGADILARYLAQALTKSLGQNVVVENKPGAGGLLGVEAGLAAPADGYTLTLVSSSYTVNPSLYKLKFDPLADITPIVQVSQGPLLVVANNALPIKTLADFVALAKTKPGQLNYASSGQGSALHLGAALFGDMAGITMNHVPYKGGGAALTDLMANQIDVYFAATASSVPLVKTGRLKALAVTGTSRIAALPEVPTIAESGYVGYDVTLWYGLIGPKGLPADIVAKLNTEVNRVLAQKETPQKLENDGAVVAGGTASHFQNVIRKEVQMWRTVVTKLGVKIE